MTLMQEMSDRALELGVPLSVHFDLTYRCNERCVHCYLDHDDYGEMTTAEIKRVLYELADAGTFFLTFSGGEVLMRRDFFELLEYARHLLFNVRIKTNAVMIREPEARRMLQLGVDQVQVSIYSHRPEVHDAIARLPGSLRRSSEAIRFLKQQGLRVVIANVLMTANMRDHAGVQALAGELGVLYTLDPTITPKMDGDRSILNLRVPARSWRAYFTTKAWWATWKSFAPRLLLLTNT
jgi:AdoMet-dependent heme synthase